MILFLLYWAMDLALKCLCAWLIYSFMTWLNAPEWMVIGTTAYGWVETKLTITRN